jgi:hypothetical protein
MSAPRQKAKEAFEKGVAECVVRSVEEVSLHTMRDAPDADLLHIEGFHVGLEIVRTVDERYLNTKKRLQEATEAIRRELEDQEIRGGFTVYFDLVAMSSNLDRAARRAWNRDVPKRIAAFFASGGEANVEHVQLQPYGITHIARIERRPASHTSVGDGWRSSTRPGETLADIALANKHHRLCHYRKNNMNHFLQYWLAIASLGPGTPEDGGFEMLLDRGYETDYDRVFLIIHDSSGKFGEAWDVTPELRKTS